MPQLPKSWAEVATVTHGFFRRHLQRALIIRDRLRLSEEAWNLLMAAGVGILGGLTNAIYYLLNQLIQWIALGQWGELTTAAAALPAWKRPLIPALGGVASGLVLFWGLRLLRSPGLTNLLEAVVAGDGRLPLRTGLVTALSSLLSISTGASIGREGLIVQLAATLSSKLGQAAQWPPYRLRLLVACGAASGIAACYKAPISGAVFAAQIVLGNFSMNLFAPLVVASVVASIISRGYFGTVQWYEVPSFDFTRLTQLPWFVLLGLVSGVVGAGFLKALPWCEKQIGRWPIPPYLRLAAAGLLVGVIGMKYPEVWGNGYGATNEILRQTVPNLQFIAGLLLAKFLATAFTVGSGTVGGVFTPTMFLGASLGSLFGGLLHTPEIDTTLPTGAFAVVGMGSMLAATTHSPLLAILIVFELSLNYSVMPPLMLACVIATLVSRRFHTESVYTEPLRRKGVELQRETPQIGAATELTVADIMRSPVPPVRENTPFAEIADRFLTSTFNFLPVVDAKGRLLGMVALHDLKEWLSTGHELSGVIAYDVLRPPPACLTPNQKLSAVLPVLLASEIRNVPVVNNLSEYKLLGTVARAEALGLLSEAISIRSSPSA
jgi:CIC family chloride channel protein